MTSPLTAYEACVLCPRNCRVDRTRGAQGYCRTPADARLSSAVLHRGEEPCLTTGGGSGTFFFSGCTLRCGSCQNCQISADGMGAEVGIDLLVEIILRLQAAGACNINFVTATHFAPSVVVAVGQARRLGLSIPVVWNSSGYEAVQTLELLSGTVDVYLPDIKTFDREFARRYLNAPDYPDRAREAVLRMLGHRELRFEGDTCVEGTIIRHLVMPGMIDDTEAVLAWFATHAEGRARLSVMTQYLPIGDSERRGPDRSLSRFEYEAVLSLLEKYDIDSGYVQELEFETDWRPDFDRTNPFPGDFAVPVWHYRGGFIDTPDR